MNTASIADHGLAPTVPLLGAQGWINPPASTEPQGGIVVMLQQWLQRLRTRVDIRELDDHLLKDVGLTRLDIEAECRKHFWQA